MAPAVPSSPRGLSEERVRAALDALPCGLILLDEGFTVQFCNAAAERVLGRGADQLLGRGFEELVDLPDRPQVREALEATGRVDGGGRRLAVRVLDARMIPAPLEASLFRIAADPATGVGVVLEEASGARRESGEVERPLTQAYSLPELLMADRLKELV